MSLFPKFRCGEVAIPATPATPLPESSKSSDCSSPTPHASSHVAYQKAAQGVKEECYAIDPLWLIDTHPEIWIEMKYLDVVLSRIEQNGELYRSALSRLEAMVQKANELYRAETKRTETN